MGTQKTNLQNVKCVAHMLLDVDIQTTAFSPMVVSHPFTNDGIVRLLDDTGNIFQLLPSDIQNYIEPFGGSGAVILEMRASSKRPTAGPSATTAST